MDIIDIGSAQLACVDHGQGETLVLVHGSNSDLRTWEPVRERLSEHFRVFAYSRRFHWPNHAITPGVDYDMRQHVADLGEVLEKIAASGAHLVGHSYGALLCLHLALQRPKSVRSLILAEPPAIRLFTGTPPTVPELGRLFLTRPRTALALAKFGVRGVMPATAALKRNSLDSALGHFGRAVLGDEAFAKLSTERLGQARQNLIPAELLGSGFAPIDRDALRQLAVPTLLMRGERSPALFAHLIDGLAELLAGAQCAEIAHASHLVHEDNPQAWLAAALEFLHRRSSAVTAPRVLPRRSCSEPLEALAPRP